MPQFLPYPLRPISRATLYAHGQKHFVTGTPGVRVLRVREEENEAVFVARRIVFLSLYYPYDLERQVTLETEPSADRILVAEIVSRHYLVDYRNALRRLCIVGGKIATRRESHTHRVKEPGRDYVPQGTLFRAGFDHSIADLPDGAVSEDSIHKAGG